MHIGFRTSGGGRGEFELVGHHGSLAAADLAGWSLNWDLPEIGECDSGIWIDPGGSGKARLRIKPGEARWQVGRQIAAILLLPPPVRERRSLVSGTPVLKEQSYFVTKIGFKQNSIFDRAAKKVVMKPAYVWVENDTDREVINFDQRWRRVQDIHNSFRMQHRYDEVLSIIQEHQDSLERRSISRKTVSISEQLNRFLDETGDVIPKIEELFDISPEDPSLPTVEEIEDDDIEMRVMSASEMRMVRARSSPARAFSDAVRNAWRHSCAFCGLKLPGRKGTIESGVDAAHILAWSEYDLDNVRNGICLCKLHHWAFDQAVLIIRHTGQEYIVEQSPRIDAFDASTQAILRAAVGPIPEDRLPRNPSERPSPQYIERLNSDIDVLNLSY